MSHLETRNKSGESLILDKERKGQFSGFGRQRIIILCDVTTDCCSIEYGVNRPLSSTIGVFLNITIVLTGTKSTA